MKKLIYILYFLFFTLTAKTQEPTIGLITHNKGSNDDGYFLLAPMNSTTTYLLDKCGYIVHKWESNYKPGLSAYLTKDGNLLKACVDTASPFKNAGGGGLFQLLDWEGNILWSYKLWNENECQHHDFKLMPNGNILAIVLENKNLDEYQIAGRNPENYVGQFWTEKIIELKPIGKDSAEIVWEWKVWDHLIQDFDMTRMNYGKVEEHPELIDINYTSAMQKKDWHHFNSIDYNEDLDQILISSRHFSEIYIVDHSTTKEEAAQHWGGKRGKGGDLLFRWGNPATYRADTSVNQKLFSQHNAYWIPKGFAYENCIMVFNNLVESNSTKHSEVNILKPEQNIDGSYKFEKIFMPMDFEWTYKSEKAIDFTAPNLSSAQLLDNGNVFICNGATGHLFEIDSNKDVVWKYINPIASNGIVKQGTKAPMTINVFKSEFYKTNYEGLVGKKLERIGLIESDNSLSEHCELFTGINFEIDNITFDLYPNPINTNINIEYESKNFQIDFYDINGNKIKEYKNVHFININGLNSGVYLIKLIDYEKNIYKYKKVLITK